MMFNRVKSATDTYGIILNVLLHAGRTAAARLHEMIESGTIVNASTYGSIL
jgi:hypothetical protein